MPLRSPSWALIDRRGYQPWLRREDPSLLWPFASGVPGLAPAHAHHVYCGSVTPSRSPARHSSASTQIDHAVLPKLLVFLTCPPSYALDNVCSHSPPITSLGF